MPCTCIIPAITTFPFHRCRGEEICVACGSHKNNEFFCCPACRNLKPKVDPKAKDGRDH